MVVCPRHPGRTCQAYAEGNVSGRSVDRQAGFFHRCYHFRVDGHHVYRSLVRLAKNRNGRRRNVSGGMEHFKCIYGIDYERYDGRFLPASERKEQRPRRHGPAHQRTGRDRPDYRRADDRRHSAVHPCRTEHSVLVAIHGRYGYSAMANGGSLHRIPFVAAQRNFFG